MEDEKPLSPATQKAVFAEIRADEHAARVRDFGEADAATYDARMAEAYRFRAEALGPEPPNPPPVTPAELERAVAEIERQWQQPSSYDQRLAEAAARMPNKPKDIDRAR